MSEETRTCIKCGQTLLLSTHFQRYAEGKSGHNRCCRSCCNKASNLSALKRRNNSHQYRLWLSSYNNARRKSIEHTIHPSDIPSPKHCRYLGVILDYRGLDQRSRRVYDAPSIDRIDSTRGYTPDNIQVISDLANSMKQNATIDQLVAFARGVLKAHATEKE